MAFVFLVFSVGCNPTTLESDLVKSTPVQVDQDMKARQFSSDTVQTGDSEQIAMINGRVFFLEIADTNATRAKGLMHREILPPDNAMLFVFSDEAVLTFWMKDTLIPLDILFLDDALEIIDIQTMVPQIGALEKDLIRYSSKQPAKFALEMNAGLTQKYEIKTGMAVQLNLN